MHGEELIHIYLHKPNDIGIIKGCQKKEPASQNALFKKYAPVLYATCYRYLANEADAKDVLQDSFIRIFKYFKNFNPEKGTLKNWMLRICINESLKMLNTKKSFIVFEKLPSEPCEQALSLDNLMMEDLIQIISSLPTPYRTVLNLNLVEGFSHQEIANQLRIEAFNSRKILSRAKKMLIKKYKLVNTETWV